MSRAHDPEWIEEKMFGEIPLNKHTCYFCLIKSSTLLKFKHEKKSFYTCAEAYNAYLYNLDPEGVSPNVIQDEYKYPCYRSIEEPF